MSDDATLLEAWRAGNAGAGNELFRRHFTSVYLFFRHRLPEDAEDLTQRAFLACLEAQERSTIVSFRAYLFGAARKLLLHRLRELYRERERFDPATVSLADLTLSPSRVVGEREDQRRLAAGLRQLPIDLQIALELHYWEDLTAAELAAVLEVPAGTARSRLARAKEALREAVEKAGADLSGLTQERLAQWLADVGRARR